MKRIPDDNYQPFAPALGDAPDENSIHAHNGVADVTDIADGNTPQMVQNDYSRNFLANDWLATIPEDLPDASPLGDAVIDLIKVIDQAHARDLIKQGLQDEGQITTLKIDHFHPSYMPYILENLYRMPNLECMRLNFSSWLVLSNASLNKFAADINLIPQLESLEVDFDWTNSEQNEPPPKKPLDVEPLRCLEHLMQHGSIKKLTINHLGCTYRIVERAFERSKNNPKLQEVKICWRMPEDKDDEEVGTFEDILECVADHSHLKSLHLDFADRIYYRDTAKGLASVFSRNKTLRVLDCPLMFTQYENMHLLEDALANNTTLKKLALKFISYDSQYSIALQGLANGIAKNTTLQFLDFLLGGGEQVDINAKILMNGLAKNSSIKSLDFCADADAIPLIGKMLFENKCLSHFRMNCDPPKSREDLQVLAMAAKEHPSLTSLEIVLTGWFGECFRQLYFDDSSLEENNVRESPAGETALSDKRPRFQDIIDQTAVDLTQKLINLGNRMVDTYLERRLLEKQNPTNEKPTTDEGLALPPDLMRLIIGTALTTPGTNAEPLLRQVFKL